MRSGYPRIFRFLVSLLLLLAFVPIQPVTADSNGILYTVQDGDTLASIAQTFHTTTGRLLQVNYFADPNDLYPGRKVIIPGFDELVGEVIRVQVPQGQSLSTFIDSFHQPFQVIKRINFLTSYDQTFGGANFYKMRTDVPMVVKNIPVTSGMTSLELAATQNISPWSAAEFNDLRGTWALLPNFMLYLPDPENETGMHNGDTTVISLPSLQAYQGKTLKIKAASIPEGAQLSGRLDVKVNDSLGTSTDYSAASFPLYFFAESDGSQTALQGIHRFARPGFASLVITTTYADGSTFSSQQNILLNRWDYGPDLPLTVDASYIDPAVTIPEWEMIKSIVQDAPDEKGWNYSFHSPSPTPEGWTSLFGRVRSYNGSDYIYFHSGMDFQGNTTTPIYAAAAGTVVFAGNLDVRGGATIISHGRGVYTGYWHQSQINVKVGDRVEFGQEIGYVGATGRVTGAHLHFEVIVGGVQVDPNEWLNGGY